ncbi:MAG: nucleoside triphosphate pyrophosphohydrolase [Halioglobus sp.]|nr:nucleoside triphosphate pyrophosphohydrolase [Halioglobus sp.]
MEEPERYSVDDLLRVMQRLRDPETGCPWDLCQNFHTIVPSTLEECYELADAIAREDFDAVVDELGDVLFQVVFYAQLGSEQRRFDLNTVVTALVSKLLRRHPHVFAGGDIDSAVKGATSVKDVTKTWESIKREERRSRQQDGVLDDVPLALPALPRAQKLQKRAADVNFDWSEVPQVLSKLKEELDELQQAVTGNNSQAMREEMGDLMFTCVNLARHLELDAEECLREANRKFEGRFRHMEASVLEGGERLSEQTEAQFDRLWQMAKFSSDLD